MIFLMWSVCGGFLLYFLTSNYLPVLIKPSYQKPVETSEDVIARNLTIINIPGTESMVEVDKKSPIPIVRELAKIRQVAQVSVCNINKYFLRIHDTLLHLCVFINSLQNWDEFNDLTNKSIMGDGSAVLAAAYLSDYELKLQNRTEGRRWHRSKERLENYPFGSYMMNKKWWLEEEFNNHMLRFQQVPE